MSRQFYSEINLHIVWHTKNSLPLLTPTIEPLAHRELRRRIVEEPRVACLRPRRHVTSVPARHAHADESMAHGD
jgi:hypothetical protein